MTLQGRAQHTLWVGDRASLGEHAWERRLAPVWIGIILDSLPAMSSGENSRFVAEIPCYAAAIPCFRRNRELMSNILICHAIKPRGRPKKGKSGTIFQIPC
jgi:hypothetical protein